MRNLLSIVLAMPAVLIVSCAPDYSSGTGMLSTSMTSMKASEATLKTRALDARQRYYQAAILVHHLPPQPTPACDDFTKPEVASCFTADRITIDAEAHPPAAPSVDAKLAALQAKPLIPRPSMGDLGKNSFGSAKATAPQQIIQGLNVPHVCKSQILANLAPPPLHLDPTKVPTERDVVNALQNYIDGLAAVTKKSDETDYETAAKKLAATVQTASTTVGTLAGGAGAAVGPIVGAVFKIGEDVYEQILKYGRYEALKAAVLAECVPVHNLTYVLSIIMTVDWTNAGLANQNTTTLQAMATGMKLSEGDRTKLNALSDQAAAELRASGLAGDPGAIPLKLLQTHNKLVQDVVDGNGMSAATLQLLTSLANDVSDLKTAIEPKAASTTTAASK